MSEEKQVRVIEVVPYNPEWKDEFSSEAERIKKIMGNEITEIHHIGSTSITGIYAKPIIDILIEVKDIDNVDSYNPQMEGLGYIAKENMGLKVVGSL